MAAQKKGLGRGLEALLADNAIEEVTQASEVGKLKIYEIEPNRNQPRRSFDATALEELAASIGEHGLIQPIVVRKKDNGYYEIVAGERRWRASKMAGLGEVPVVIKELSDKDAAFLSMVENLQREDLNPVEEAKGYKALIDNFGLTQEEAASKVGKSRANVTNILRLLKLPAGILELVESGRLSYGHARALLPLVAALGDEEATIQAKKVVDRQLSVRETEIHVKTLCTPDAKKDETEDKVKRSYYNELERRASERFGRRIKLNENTLSIPYKDSDDLELLLSSLCGKEMFYDEA